MNVAQPGFARKSHRMLLVTEPNFGEGDSKMTEGAWATKAVESFEGELRKYLGYGAGSPAPDSAAAEGNE